MRDLDQDELIDQWTLVGAELELVSGKRGATRLGFALVLRFYTERGRFPRGRGEIPDAAVEYIARQVGVTPTDIAFYEWSGRTIEYHRAQIRSASRLHTTVMTSPTTCVSPAFHILGSGTRQQHPKKDPASRQRPGRIQTGSFRKSFH